MQEARPPPHPQLLTVLNGTVGQEVLDGVCIDQPQVPALSRHTVLRTEEILSIPDNAFEPFSQS